MFCFLAGLVVVGQREGECPVLLGRGWIAKLFFQCCKPVIGKKCGSFFRLGRAGQVILKHFGGQRQVAIGPGQHRSPIEKRDGCVFVAFGAGDGAMHGGLHLRQALVAAIEAGQRDPLQGWMRAGGNRLLVFTLSRLGIFASFGDSPAQLVGTRRIHLFKLAAKCFRFVNATANRTGRLKVEIAQVGERVGIAWIELDCLFEFRPNALGQRVGAEEVGAIGLLAQCTAKPQAIVGVLAVKANSLLASADRCVPLLKGVAHAAFEVFGFSGAGVGKGLEQGEGLVCLAGLECGTDLGQRILLSHRGLRRLSQRGLGRRYGRKGRDQQTRGQNG